MSRTLPKNGLHIRIKEGDKLRQEHCRAARKEEEREEIDQGEYDVELFVHESVIPDQGQTMDN